MLAGSWAEQRQWAVANPLEALAGGGPAVADLAADISKRLELQRPALAFDTTGMVKLERLGRQTASQKKKAGCDVFPAGENTSCAYSIEKVAGWLDLWVTNRGALGGGLLRKAWPYGFGQLRYQTLNDESYVPLRAEYLWKQSNKSCCEL